MPGYTGQRPDDFVERLAVELRAIDRQLGELQKPSATQKANAVARLAEAEAALVTAGQQIAEAAALITGLRADLAVQRQWNTSQDSDLRSAKSRLDSQDAWNDSQDANIRDIWTKNSQQDSRLDSQDAWNNSQDADMRGVWAKDAAQDGAIGAARSVADDAAAKASTANAKANSVYRDLVRLWQELYQKSVVVNPPPSADPT